MKTRFDKAVDKVDKLLRRQLAAKDELAKLKTELNTFSTWLGKARRILEDKERALSDLQRLDSSADSTREFVSDVIAHQADLRFITMSAQKFVEEGKVRFIKSIFFPINLRTNCFVMLVYAFLRPVSQDNGR